MHRCSTSALSYGYASHLCHSLHRTGRRPARGPQRAVQVLEVIDHYSGSCLREGRPIAAHTHLRQGRQGKADVPRRGSGPKFARNSVHIRHLPGCWSQARHAGRNASDAKHLVILQPQPRSPRPGRLRRAIRRCRLPSTHLATCHWRVTWTPPRGISSSCRTKGRIGAGAACARSGIEGENVGREPIQRAMHPLFD